MAHERIAEYLELKNKDIEEKIELLTEIYREIVPEDLESHDLETYIVLFWFSWYLIYRLTKYIMQLCFPEAVDLVDDIIDELLNRHNEYHKQLQLPNYTPYQKWSPVEIGSPSTRKLGFTLFYTLSVREFMFDDC